MCVINVTDCESLWVIDSQNKKSKGQCCPCLNIFLMKISGMFLSFSSRWLTKELEWEVHLGVPCLSDIVIDRERERLTYMVGIKKMWRFLKASNWAHLSPYLVPLPLIPPKILKNTYHSLLLCLNIPKVWTSRFCGPCWTDDYENIFAKILFLSLYLGATINLISTNLTCNQVNLYHYFTNKKILTWLIDGTVCTFKV